ncbi:MAG TPA: BON domain-containing protein [Gemmatimonadales bacterium]|nr:BON domain-containing protein [Gemmatimonadales bacterium]
MQRKRPTGAGRERMPEPGSDEQIWEDVHDQLMENPDIDATEVEVSVDDGEVTLTGRVDSREAKWLAEEIVRAIPGVADVRNKLKIARL